jgi:hypothetical protein
VNASFTAAIVVRSLLAAERSSWVVGVLVGWVVDRLVVVWPVSWEVVVVVDMKWFLCEKWFLSAKKKRIFVRTGEADSGNIDDPADKGYSPASGSTPSYRYCKHPPPSRRAIER